MIDPIQTPGGISLVEIKDFRKICLRRRDLCKLVTNFDSLPLREQKEYKELIMGLFVRVTYAGEYLLGKIEDLVVEK